MQISIAELIAAASRIFAVPTDEIIGRSRRQPVYRARLAVALAGREARHNQSEIGEALGRRGAERIWRYCEVAEALAANDMAYWTACDRLVATSGAWG